MSNKKVIEFSSNCERYLLVDVPEKTISAIIENGILILLHNDTKSRIDLEPTNNNDSETNYQIIGICKDLPFEVWDEVLGEIFLNWFESLGATENYLLIKII